MNSFLEVFQSLCLINMLTKSARYLNSTVKDTNEKPCTLKPEKNQFTCKILTVVPLLVLGLVTKSQSRPGGPCSPLIPLRMNKQELQRQLSTEVYFGNTVM